MVTLIIGVQGKFVRLKMAFGLSLQLSSREMAVEDGRNGR